MMVIVMQKGRRGYVLAKKIGPRVAMRLDFKEDYPPVRSIQVGLHKIKGKEYLGVTIDVGRGRTIKTG